MNIQSTHPRPRANAPKRPAEAQSEAKPSGLSESQKMAMFGTGLGAVTVGATTSLGIESVQAFSRGSYLLGTGLAVGTVAAGAATLFAGGTAVMAGASGNNSGLRGFLAGGVLAAGVAAVLL